MEQPQLATIWAKIRGQLQAELGEAEYRNWLRPMTLAGIDGDEVVISLPTAFVRDWVRDRHGPRVTALWQTAAPDVRRVDFVVGDPARPAIEPMAEHFAARGVTQAATVSARARAEADDRGLQFLQNSHVPFGRTQRAGNAASATGGSDVDRDT